VSLVYARRVVRARAVLVNLTHTAELRCLSPAAVTARFGTRVY
jgi:hypothetical protein